VALATDVDTHEVSIPRSAALRCNTWHDEMIAGSTRLSAWPQEPGSFRRAGNRRSRPLLLAAVKGIVHAPSAKPAMKPESRDALLTAIVKARGWIDAQPRDCQASSPGQTAESPARLPSPSFRPALSRPSLMAPRLRISRSPASPERCRIRGPSRRNTSDSRNKTSRVQDGHAAPLSIHALISSPNNCCVPGTGSRPLPGCQP
jgi:hypothetical protein